MRVTSAKNAPSLYICKNLIIFVVFYFSVSKANIDHEAFEFASELVCRFPIRHFQVITSKIFKW